MDLLCCVKVLNLPPTITYNDLGSLFSFAGDIVDIVINAVNERENEAIITYTSPGMAAEAVEKFSNQCFDGIPCDVQFLVPRSVPPQRCDWNRRSASHPDTRFNYSPYPYHQEQQVHRSDKRSMHLNIPNAHTYQSSLDNETNHHSTMSTRIPKRDSYPNKAKSRSSFSQGDHNSSRPQPPMYQPPQSQPPMYQPPPVYMPQPPNPSYMYQSPPYMQPPSNMQPPAFVQYPPVYVQPQYPSRPQSQSRPRPRPRPQYSVSHQQPPSHEHYEGKVVPEQSHYKMRSKPRPAPQMSSKPDTRLESPSFDSNRTDSHSPSEMLSEPQPPLLQVNPVGQTPTESKPDLPIQSFLEASACGLLIENLSVNFNERTVRGIFRTFGAINRVQFIDNTTVALYFQKEQDASVAKRVMDGRTIEGGVLSISILLPNGGEEDDEVPPINPKDFALFAAQVAKINHRNFINSLLGLTAMPPLPAQTLPPPLETEMPGPPLHAHFTRPVASMPITTPQQVEEPINSQSPEEEEEEEEEPAPQSQANNVEMINLIEDTINMNYGEVDEDALEGMNEEEVIDYFRELLLGVVYAYDSTNTDDIVNAILLNDKNTVFKALNDPAMLYNLIMQSQEN